MSEEGSAASLAAAREAMIAKRFGGTSAAVQMGGKGSMRRKTKSATRSTGADCDRKLAAATKKLGMQVISGVEEVNLFKDDFKVIHFKAPKVSAALQANTFVISGNAETKALQELLPGIVSQLGPDQYASIQQSHAQQQQQQRGGGGGGARQSAPAGQDEDDEDDDDVPALVEGEDFQAVSNK